MQVKGAEVALERRGECWAKTLGHIVIARMRMKPVVGPASLGLIERFKVGLLGNDRRSRCRIGKPIRNVKRLLAASQGVRPKLPDALVQRSFVAAT